MTKISEKEAKRHALAAKGIKRNEKNNYKILSIALIISLIGVSLSLTYMIAVKQGEATNYKSRYDLCIEQIQRNWEGFQTLFVFINPVSFDDNVLLGEDENYLYIAHLETVTLWNISGTKFRVPKGADGEYLHELIEVIE